MAYVSVDIDLDEIDFDDLLHEVAKQMRKKKLNNLSRREKEDIAEIYDILCANFNKEQIEGIKVQTIEDELKVKLLIEKFKNCSLSQIEAICNNN